MHLPNEIEELWDLVVDCGGNRRDNGSDLDVVGGGGCRELVLELLGKLPGLLYFPMLFFGIVNARFEMFVPFVLLLLLLGGILVRIGGIIVVFWLRN